MQSEINLTNLLMEGFKPLHHFTIIIIVRSII
nr:MAG TPA: hypothetical protein [Caudoviricetes sp.]